MKIIKTILGAFELIFLTLAIITLIWLSTKTAYIEEYNPHDLVITMLCFFGISFSFGTMKYLLRKLLENLSDKQAK